MAECRGDRVSRSCSEARFALGGKGSGIVEDRAELDRGDSPSLLWRTVCRSWSRSVCAAGRKSNTKSFATQAPTTASPSATWRTSIRWASTPVSRSWSRPRRPQRRGVSLPARDRDSGRPPPRDHRRMQHPVRARPPTSLEYRVIEINARLSRSSALASKATGLSARLRRGQARHRLHASGDPELDHPSGRPPSSSPRSTTSSARFRAGTSPSSRAPQWASEAR